jgi:hypothetical protein
MAAPTDKPPGKPEPPAPPESPGAQEAGQLAQDDRGNVTWEWANDEVLQADDTAGAILRLRALVDPSLGIIDDDAPNALKSNPKGLKVGYDPYDSGTLGKTERKKKKDLRELSKWIETKRKIDDGAEPADE